MEDLLDHSQMLHFPYYFQIHDIPKASLWSKGLRKLAGDNKLR